MHFGSMFITTVCMKLNWNFQRGGEVLEKNPFPGGGMDIFWNYTFGHTTQVNTS